MAWLPRLKQGWLLKDLLNIRDRFFGYLYTNNKKIITVDLLNTVFNIQFIYLSDGYCRYIPLKSTRQ